MVNHSDIFVRKCANIKSRKITDVQCCLLATRGDFCSRHWKHPRRFVPAMTLSEKRYTRNEHRAAISIQTAWRQKSVHLFIKQQGIGIYNRSISNNDTEIYSLDSILDIPKLYYFSFIDGRNKLWSFDIRTFGKILSLGDLKQNPYNRDALSEATISKIRKRLMWFRNRKYPVFYPVGSEMTPEQVWGQKILDIFMKIESFGYYVCCDWFTEMTIADHKKFYSTLYELWNYRLGLTAIDRDRIVPGHYTQKLFPFLPDVLETRRKKSKVWWEELNLKLMEAFVSRSPDKEQQKLGAMYCVMGLVAISPAAANVFPWFEG